MLTQNNNILHGLRELTISAIYLTGRMSSFPATDLCVVMRAQDGELAFPRLRDICIEHAPSAATVEIPDLHVIPVDVLSRQLDEAALYLLRYARMRKDQDVKLLRTVALPTDLLQKHWAIELNDLLERRVVSYEEFLGENDEMETTDCRAVVLYRPE